MKHEIDIFSEIVDSIRDRYDILSYSHVGTTYVFTTDNLGDMLVDDYIEILGIDCLVTAVDSNLLQFTIVSESDLETAQWWKAKKPYFDYEKVLGESNTLLEKTNSAIYRLQKYPLIFLPLDIEQERDVDSAIQIQLKNVIFYILTSTENNNQYANWRLTNIFKTILIPIYEKFFEAVKISPYIYDKNNLINHLYIENYLQSDNNNNIFNEYTDAIQLRFSNISLINLSSSCDKFAIAPLPYIVFSYSNFNAVYADDIDYNDIINCSLTATNNSAIAQNCIVNFKTGKYIVQVQQTIAANSSVVFEYTFEDIDIFQENIVTAIDLQNNTIGSVTIPAYPEFEMFFDAQVENMTAMITLSANDFCNIYWGDGTSDEIILSGNYSHNSSEYSHTYLSTGLKRITFTDARRLQMFYISYLNTKTYSSYYISDISQLRNLHYFGIFVGSGGVSFNKNITFTPSAFAKATKNTDNIYLSTLKGFVNDLCFSRKIYTNITLRFAYNFNVSANKLATIMYYCKSFRIYAASVDETPYTNRTININSLILAPYITSSFLFSYCNCPNIDRNSNFGNGYTYNFQSSNLTSEAVDNAIYVVRNTNNYTGTGVKTLNLSNNSRRTHASDADLAILLSRGWGVTVSEPL